VLAFDPEWLAVTRAFHPYLTSAYSQTAFPEEALARAMVAEEAEWVARNVRGGGLRVDEWQVFAQTAPGPGGEGKGKMQQPPVYTNGQTEAFCRMLGLENKINPRVVGKAGGGVDEGSTAGSMSGVT